MWTLAALRSEDELLVSEETSWMSVTERERADVRSMKQSTTLHYSSTKTNTQIKVFSSNFHLKLQHFKTILIFTMLRVCRADV